MAIFDAGKKAAEFAKKVINTITGLKDKVVGALKDAGEWLKSAGGDIIRGLGAGIDAAKQWLKDKAEAVAGWLPGWIKKRLGIASPSKVMAALGRWVPIGLAKGIDKGAPAAVKAAKALAQKTIDGVKSQIEAFKSLRDAIIHLPASYRSAVVLHDVHGLTSPEIAQVQEVSVAAVKQRIARGRAMLVTHLARGTERRAATGDVPLRCWDARSRVSDYLDDELTARERAVLERHLGGCPTCPALYAGLVGVRAALGALRDPDTVVPPAIAARLRGE